MTNAELIAQLRAEIEKRKTKAEAERVLYPKTILSAKNLLLINDYVELLSFLDTLESEKPMNKDCNGCPHCIDRKDQYGWHFKGCFGGPYNGKFIAEIDECPLKQEQPEVNLKEKEIKESEIPNDLEAQGSNKDGWHIEITNYQEGEE